ncbi:MAG: methyltransferase [Deltaproteobacteria bacterium]|nr:methyltransferase [Deltaproteobacteria bacterium]
MKIANKNIELQDDESIYSLGSFSLIHGKTGQQLTSDTVSLAKFIPFLQQNSRVIELGTGIGAIVLMLAERFRDLNITGIEIDNPTFQISKKNLKINDLQDRVALLNCDWRSLYGKFPRGSFDCLIANPPYKKQGTGRLSPDSSRALARSEVAGTLEELLKISAYLIGSTGRLYFIFPLERLVELFEEFAKNKISPGRLVILDGLNEKKSLFLIEAGAGCSLSVEVEKPSLRP